MASRLFTLLLDFIPLALYHLCFYRVEEWPSGQWQQTVNLPSYEFAGSNPASSTTFSPSMIISCLECTLLVGFIEFLKLLCSNLLILLQKLLRPAS